jgi:ABC-2 type transport system ATP-binding protein
VSAAPAIRTHDVSKWYGEVLGVNRVTLDIGPGVTSLIGPNGAGKSTLLGLVSGLLRPSKGWVEVLGVPASDPERLHQVLGTCTAHDAFHPGFTGEQFLRGLIGLRGLPWGETRDLADEGLRRVGLTEARKKKIGAYSKGMRQRLKLALALATRPPVLLLDEPLNGLDPLARRDVIDLMQERARDGATVLISSHVLHEVDLLAEGVVMLHAGRVVAEGGITEVRGEIVERPLQVRVECDAPDRLASRAFDEGLVLSARRTPTALIVETRAPLRFARTVAALAAEGGLVVTELELVDENVQAVYDYLIRPQVAS